MANLNMQTDNKFLEYLGFAFLTFDDFCDRERDVAESGMSFSTSFILAAISVYDSHYSQQIYIEHGQGNLVAMLKDAIGWTPSGAARSDQQASALQ